MVEAVITEKVMRTVTVLMTAMMAVVMMMMAADDTDLSRRERAVIEIS